MKKDVVDDIFDRVKQILGEKFSGEVTVLLEKEEKEIRKIYGKDAHYVGSYERKLKAEAKKNALILIRQGVSVSQASKKSGISHNEMYKLLRKRSVNG